MIDREKFEEEYSDIFQTQRGTDKQLIVGNLKEGIHLTIYSLQSLSIWLMKEGVQYLKAKMTMLVKLGEVCMQQISHVTSKSKEFMLQTI